MEALKQNFTRWQAEHPPGSLPQPAPCAPAAAGDAPASSVSLGDKLGNAVDMAKIVIYAGIAKLLGQDEDNTISDNMVKYTGERVWRLSVRVCGLSVQV